MTQKPVFLEGLFTLRNIRSIGAAAVIEVLLGAGIAGILIWHQLQPVKDVSKPPIAVDPVPELPTPVQRSNPEPVPPQSRDLSQVPPVRESIPDPVAQPVQPPSLPPVVQQARPSAGLMDQFSADMLRAITAQKVYPKISMLKGETGEAVVSFDYVDGVVSDIRVDRSSGSRDLDKAAIEAVRKAALPPKPAALAGLDHFTFTLAFGMPD